MHPGLSLLISYFILAGCVDKTDRVKPASKLADTIIEKGIFDSHPTEDSLLLDTINYDQVVLNGLPLQLDTLTPINAFGQPHSKNIYGLGTCYTFGDAPLWHFDGCLYNISGHSLYFHELYFDSNSENPDLIVQLPKLKVSGKTNIKEFKQAYPTSFTNSKQRFPNTILLRTGEPLYCQFRFEYKDKKLWRFAIGM